MVTSNNETSQRTKQKILLFFLLCIIQIRATKKICLVPVGNFRHIGISAPVIVNGTIVNIADKWPGRVFMERKYLSYLTE